MPGTVRTTVESTIDQSYLVLYIPSDEFGVTQPDTLKLAIADLLGHTPRSMSDQDVATALRDAAAAFDIEL